MNNSISCLCLVLHCSTVFKIISFSILEFGFSAPPVVCFPSRGSAASEKGVAVGLKEDANEGPYTGQRRAGFSFANEGA